MALHQHGFGPQASFDPFNPQQAGNQVQQLAQPQPQPPAPSVAAGLSGAIPTAENENQSKFFQALMADREGTINRLVDMGVDPDSINVPFNDDFGNPLTQVNVDPNTPPIAGEAPPVQGGFDPNKTAQALGAIKPPPDNTPPPLAPPRAIAPPQGRGSIDPNLLAQILQLLQGSNQPQQSVPSLGQLIGG